MTAIAVLASGRGSNFEALLRAVQSQMLEAEIVALVCDRPGAPVIEKARQAEIPVLEMPRVENRAVHDQNILDALKPFRPRFLVMAGYMKIVTRILLEAFRSEKKYSRVVNIHPSLLPSFPGVRSYAQAFSYGVQVTGVTVHLVEENIDAGPICAQEAFSMGACRSVEEVEAKGLEIEHRLYPETLRWVLPENFEVGPRESIGRLCVRPR